MATSNSRPAPERIPLIAVVLSVVFILIAVVAIWWVTQPAFGYTNSPYQDNPTQITVGK